MTICQFLKTFERLTFDQQWDILDMIFPCKSGYARSLQDMFLTHYDGNGFLWYGNLLPSEKRDILHFVNLHNLVANSLVQ